MRPRQIALLLSLACLTVTAPLAAQVKGRVLGKHEPIANSTVTLWAASQGAPAAIGHATTDAEGRFEIKAGGSRPAGSILYLVAKGGTPHGQKTDNPAIALLAVLGASAPEHVTINEFTTIASAYTGAQFLKGDAMSGHALGLKIAAGNVPSFVDLATGGWGGTIQDPLNGEQTTTMANFATIADALAGCIARVAGDACPTLFAASAGPAGAAPTNTLEAVEAIARYPWYKPERLLALLLAFYPIERGKSMLTVPFMPYLGMGA